MTDDLKARLQKAYPLGTIYEPDESAYESDERDKRLNNSLNRVVTEHPLNYMVEPFDKPAYEIVITQLDHPSFSEWVWRMSNTEKISWIKKNGGPYPVFWLKVSRVADYYYYFYNHWTPRGDSGYLDADFKRKPNELWLSYENSIRRTLESYAFRYITDDVGLETVPFIEEHDYDSIPDDDPRWEDDDFEPPIVPCYVHKLLFRI